MALYRNISVNFWTDPKVDDEFTPEDKYFYLYLLTNPHTNICGCYEISIKQMERETGYNKDTINRLLKRMEQTHNVVRYDDNTKELFLLNWSKYNWTSSEKVKKAVVSVAQYIKSETFKNIIIDLINNNINIKDITDNRTDTDTESESDTDVSIGYTYPIDTVSQKPQKHKFGEYKHVLLTDDEYKKLCDDYGQSIADKYIQKVDDYCEMKGKSYKNYNLAIRNTFMSRDNVKPIHQSESDLYKGMTKDDEGFYVDKDGYRYV